MALRRGQAQNVKNVWSICAKRFCAAYKKVLYMEPSGSSKKRPTTADQVGLFRDQVRDQDGSLNIWTGDSKVLLLRPEPKKGCCGWSQKDMEYPLGQKSKSKKKREFCTVTEREL